MLQIPPAGWPLERFCHSVYIPSRLSLSPRAAEEVLRIARQWDEFCGLPVGELSDQSVIAFLRARLALGDRPATINAKRSKILALWRCAWRKHIVTDLPRDVPRMREPHDPPKARSTEEIEAILGRCQSLQGTTAGIPRSSYWAALFAAAAATGERPGALIRTLTEDVDLAEARMRILAAVEKTSSGRLYSLTDWAVAAIAKIYDPRRLLIWPWPHCRRHLWTSARRIMESAGIRPNPKTKDLFYSLRRWHLSHLAAQSIELARSQAGHSSTALTLRHYIDPTIAENRRAVEALPRLTLSVVKAHRQLRLF